MPHDAPVRDALVVRGRDGVAFVALRCEITAFSLSTKHPIGARSVLVERMSSVI